MSVQDGDIASIKVSIVFQAGQIEMSVGDVQALAPGMVMPVDRSQDELVDIVANGKKIGTGELVKVGDKLGVRVTGLVSDA